MKRLLQTLVLMLVALMVPATATAAYVQLADGVYQDGTTLCIGSNVTSLGLLNLNPSVIYCYAQTPPACMSNTFTGYGATLHVPTSAMVSYFTALYWYNFNNILADAVEPQFVTLNMTDVELELGQQLSLSATVTPSNAAPNTVYWSSTNTSVATVQDGVLTAVGEGECYIRAICVDKQAICHVTVTGSFGSGDVNHDGEVNIADVNAIINVILKDISNQDVDVNHDGEVNIADVNAVIKIILGGSDSSDTSHTETFTVNGVSFKMVAVDGGTFTMGACDDDTEAVGREKPAHQVTLSGYSIGETEVTQALWQAVMGSNPSYFTSVMGYTDDLTCPVDNVSWNDCQEFIYKLNSLTGKKFRLPTEAEWEYAARGGKKSNGYKYAGSNNINDVGWCWGNLPSDISLTDGCRPQSVASKTPNELGLYDMSGNVYEMCLDWLGNYGSSAQTNPKGPVTGFYRVERGGGWDGDRRYCRVSFRFGTDPLIAYINGPGLRLAFDEENSPKFHLSETVVAVFEGETVTANILNGSGSYSVDGGTDCVNTTINGEMLTITGIVAGTATVHVTDNTTGATTVLTVIVKPATITDDTFTINGVSFKMVAIEGGTFTMGATPEQGSDAYDSEKPAHKVSLSSFSIGETEVTQELWLAVMGSNPSWFTPTNGYAENLQRPVECVSWNACQQFITKLNQMTGKNFRLPTEAEWEFAARGGSKSWGYKYAGSHIIGNVAWYYDNSGGLGYGIPDYGTHTVATKAPNELGLYDMSGNVWEWCQDWNGDYSNEDQMNPTGPASGSYRMVRGGSWDYHARYCRVSNRGCCMPSDTYNIFGLRLAL